MNSKVNKSSNKSPRRPRRRRSRRRARPGWGRGRFRFARADVAQRLRRLLKEGFQCQGILQPGQAMWRITEDPLGGGSALVEAIVLNLAGEVSWLARQVPLAAAWSKVAVGRDQHDISEEGGKW
jgi:hypothetical protein